MSISASLTADVPVETCSDRADSRPNMEYLFDRYSVGIYRYISLRVGRNPALADELMQQLWLQACKPGRAVPPDEFEFWLRRVAQNRISDHGRRKCRRPAQIPIENAEIAGEHEIGEDQRHIPNKLKIQIAYPHDDGVTQVFDMAGLLKLFAPQPNRGRTADDS